MRDIILEQHPDCTIESRRTFNTDINTLYSTWSNPEYLKQWWGPKGFTNTFLEFDLTPGGRWKFIMHGPDKGNYNNECIFLKIDKPNLLIWNHISPPEFQIVASFTEPVPGQTALSFKMVFESAAACNKLKSFVPEKNEENFDRLEQLLKNIK
jgi:uncharacterized protein YndB with AHSA1/START domain